MLPVFGGTVQQESYSQQLLADFAAAWMDQEMGDVSLNLKPKPHVVILFVCLLACFYKADLLNLDP